MHILKNTRTVQTIFSHPCIEPSIYTSFTQKIVKSKVLKKIICHDFINGTQQFHCLIHFHSSDATGSLKNIIVNDFRDFLIILKRH